MLLIIFEIFIWKFFIKKFLFCWNHRWFVQMRNCINSVWKEGVKAEEKETFYSFSTFSTDILIIYEREMHDINVKSFQQFVLIFSLHSIERNYYFTIFAIHFEHEYMHDVKEKCLIIARRRQLCDTFRIFERGEPFLSTSSLTRSLARSLFFCDAREYFKTCSQKKSSFYMILFRS